MVPQTIRLIRREKWYQAHSSHVYQRMTDLGMTHRKVTSIELLVVVACGGYWVWAKERAMEARQE